MEGSLRRPFSVFAYCFGEWEICAWTGGAVISRREELFSAEGCGLAGYRIEAGMTEN